MKAPGPARVISGSPKIQLALVTSLLLKLGLYVVNEVFFATLGYSLMAGMPSQSCEYARQIHMRQE